MGIKRYHDRLLGEIAQGMSTTAAHLNRLELERLGRRAVAACEFRHMLADLKERLARRDANRCGRTVLPHIEAPSQAA